MNRVRNTEPRSRRAARTDDSRIAGTVPAVATAYRILEALADVRPQGGTLTELTNALGLSKSTMHGQLATLCACGLAERDEVTRRYRLGSALIHLGQAASTEPDLRTLAAQALPTLAGEHQLTFALATVEPPLKAVLTERAYPLQAVHVGVALGNTYSVFDGAIGKCLLADMTPEAAHDVVHAGPVPQHTDRTIRDPDKLLAEAAAVRERGWATSAGELKQNHAVAVPLREPNGTLAFVLCALGFPSEIPRATFPILGEVIREASRAIEISASGQIQEARWQKRK